MNDKKNNQKMIKLYYDTESLFYGVSLLSKSDEDFANMIYNTKIHLNIYPSVDYSQIDNDKIKKYVLNKALNLVSMNIINEPTNYMWQLSLTRNTFNLRTDKYNSFGWSIIKDNDKDIYIEYILHYMVSRLIVII